MTTTKTGKVSISVTMTPETYRLLENICAMERRSKSRQIVWMIIKQSIAMLDYLEEKAPSPPLGKNVIRPDLSVWGRTTSV